MYFIIFRQMYESFSYFKKIITKKLFSLSHTGYTIFNF
ncbi:hypothetical protein M091_3666 [Parabacteroides distasonis str. 3776 D15 i]|uniref:Uncharacterized protein n=1 Tax=Parabacteroides distasonis str. 3776 D15 i TaxID=1339342 RepID=A0AB34LD51_PARDI|nr:hypothetical protein M091_3666 [Parabacteroides distasonis str. 3776 D15 i]KDS59759.1 hypothetical protein M095_3918 [Parabacteroides distasonis str. 3999B T(B) 4]